MIEDPTPAVTPAPIDVPEQPMEPAPLEIPSQDPPHPDPAPGQPEVDPDRG